MSKRPRLSQEVIDGYRRQRIIAAVARLVSEHGYRGVHVGDITYGAKIARNTFYETFSGKDAAFAATVEQAAKDAIEAVEQGAEDGGHSGAIDALAGWVEDNLAEARCLLIVAPGTMPDLYQSVLDAAKAKIPLEDTIAELVLGAVLSIVSRWAGNVKDELDLEGLRAFVAPHFAEAPAGVPVAA